MSQSYLVDYRIAKDISLPTVQICEYIAEQLPFSEWDPQTQATLSLALFPIGPLQVNGSWTPDAENALRLIRHLIAGGNYLTAPESLRSKVRSIPDHHMATFLIKAAKVRNELFNVTRSGALTGLVAVHHG